MIPHFFYFIEVFLVNQHSFLKYVFPSIMTLGVSGLTYLNSFQLTLYHLKLNSLSQKTYSSFHLHKIRPFKGLNVYIIGLDLILFAHNKCDQIIISYT